ncbi:hypothetical protein OCAE111667_21310 [Occultella aeris]|uniref:Uncharacterized protein n=1 Tax=Occultella aeris TaxID=2761496 RepID=A0A7M4DH57_9MICO|nr:hypothetical protein [Occultella aeris]VZO36250.1 hypothetical protein HALOF300_01454 [Occultella aeris]
MEPDPGHRRDDEELRLAKEGARDFAFNPNEVVPIPSARRGRATSRVAQVSLIVGAVVAAALIGVLLFAALS